MKKRLKYIDMCKGAAIFCVLLGHSLQYCGKGEPYNNSLWTFIYAFHMPLFMILSGFFLQNSLILPLKSFVIKKFKQLIIPCILFYLCINIPIILIKTKTFNISPTEYLWNFINTLWFLKSLFVCFIISYLSIRLIKNDIIASLASILLVILIGRFNMFYVNTMLPFFWCGYFFSKFKETIFANVRFVFLFSTIVSLILFLFWNGYYTVYYTPLSHPLEYENFAIYVFRVIIGLSCSIPTVIICKYISDKYMTKILIIRFISIGKNTLGIYLLQTYTLEMIIPYLQLELSSTTLYYTSILLAITELIFCNFLVIQMRKNTIIRKLLLGEYKT